MGRRLWAIGLLALVVGCGARSAARPGIDRQGWLAVRTPHFLVTTDVGEDDARRLARDLEIHWYALTGFYNWMTPGRPAPTRTFHLYYLRYRDDFMPLTGDLPSAGYVTMAADFTGDRIAVTYRESRAGNEIVLHELTHMFNGHYLSRAPTWLNEGLAGYLQTLEVRGNQVRMGAPSISSADLFGRATWVGLNELVGASYEQFHGAKRHRNYFAAWKLVHLLNNASPDYHRRFRRYLSALARGDDRERAWTTAFGDRLDEIDRDFRRYQTRRELEVWTARMPLPSIAEPEVRRLSPGEAHAAWMQLLLTSNRSNDDLTREVVRQLASTPDGPVRQFWTAVAATRLRASGPGLGDPETLFRAYLRRHPDDTRGWAALVSIGIDRAVAGGYLGVEDEVPAGLAALEPDVLELVKRSSTAHELNLIGWYFALAGKARTGQPFALRALAAQPGCGACVDTLALIEYRLGHPDRAAELQRRAMNMMGDGLPDDVARRLAAYRRASSGD